MSWPAWLARRAVPAEQRLRFAVAADGILRTALGSDPRLQLIFVVRGPLGSKEDRLIVCKRKMATRSQMEHTALTADIEDKTLRIRASPVQELVTGIPA